VNPALPFANLLSKPNGNPDEKFIPSVAF